MRAVCWYGVGDVRVCDVPEPTIVNDRDAVVKVTTSAICGSDLHLLDGYVPTMREGDIIGHEFMGEVVEVGPGVGNLAVGDRVVVPFSIACGKCWFCERELYSQCDDSNPNAWMPEELYGYSPGGFFGYSHAFGGYAGGQAEYVRVPYADVGHLKLPDDVTDEQAVFLGDAFPTGFMGAELCEIKPNDIVAVWGCGPVGQFAIRSAFLLGAARVIAIDRYPARLAMAEKAGAEVIDDAAVDDVLKAVKEKTGGMGPDAVIECVGAEAHGEGLAYAYDRAKSALRLETDRPYALRQAIEACRKGGIVSVMGVYGGFVDKFPMGAIVNKALTLKSGQAHVQKYMRPLLERIRRGEIDPSEIVTHVMPLDDAPEAYRMFRDKADGVVKVLLKP